LLGAAKLGVVAGSAVAGLLGLTLGFLFFGSRSALSSEPDERAPGSAPPDRGG
jgi:hypothetical protein